jgi:hypothetical protein
MKKDPVSSQIGSIRPVKNVNEMDDHKMFEINRQKQFQSLNADTVWRTKER